MSKQTEEMQSIGIASVHRKNFPVETLGIPLPPGLVMLDSLFEEFCHRDSYLFWSYFRLHPALITVHGNVSRSTRSVRPAADRAIL